MKFHKVTTESINFYNQNTFSYHKNGYTIVVDFACKVDFIHSLREALLDGKVGPTAEAEDVFKEICGSNVKQDDIYEADFETAVSATGFGKFNLLLFLIMIPSSLAAMLAATTPSFILPAAQCDLDLSLNDKGLLNASAYFGMIASAFLWGYLSDTIGRKKVLVYGYTLDAIFVLICGVSQNFVMLFVAKLITGFVISGPFAALLTSISEFHCAKYRSRISMVNGVIHSAASILLPVVAWLVLPANINWAFFEEKFVIHSWNFFFIICALPSFISSILHRMLPESPKFLMTTGKNVEALAVFKRVYSLNTGMHPSTFPIKSLVDETKLKGDEISKHGGHVTANRTKMQALREGWQQITPLFFPPHLLKTVVAYCAQFTMMLGLNTLRLWLPQLFTTINEYQAAHVGNSSVSICEILTIGSNAGVQNGTRTCFVSYNSVYINLIIISIVTLVGYVITGFLINALGKKAMLVTLGVAAGLCSLGTSFAQNEETVVALAALYLSFSGICMGILMSASVDMMPTTLRTMTLSLLMMFGRLGSLIGNVTFPALLSAGCLPAFVSIGIVTIGGAMITLLLPNTDLKALR